MPYIWAGSSYQPTGHYGYPDYPNGALRTSAESLARFMAMAMDGGELEGVRILAEDTMVEMWTPHYPELDDTQGLSWYSWRLQGEDLWGHDGGDAGVATQAAIRWSDEIGVVFLMNSGGTQWDTFESLEQALFSAGSEL
jgi:CubicO group peptidase (beta-lactamase class C family)